MCARSSSRNSNEQWKAAEMHSGSDGYSLHCSILAARRFISARTRETASANRDALLFPSCSALRARSAIFSSAAESSRVERSARVRLPMCTAHCTILHSLCVASARRAIQCIARRRDSLASLLCSSRYSATRTFARSLSNTRSRGHPALR